MQMVVGMRVKALLFGILVVVGAVLPYLLADAKFRELFSPQTGGSTLDSEAPAAVMADKLPSSEPIAVQPPVGSLMPAENSVTTSPPTNSYVGGTRSHQAAGTGCVCK